MNCFVCLGLRLQCIRAAYVFYHFLSILADDVDIRNIHRLSHAFRTYQNCIQSHRASFSLGPFANAVVQMVVTLLGIAFDDD